MATTTDISEANKWNPVTHPYMVRTNKQRTSYCANIVSQGPFATLDEALAVADRPMKAGEISRWIVEAQNPQTWDDNGSWKTVFTRKRKPRITNPA